MQFEWDGTRYDSSRMRSYCTGMASMPTVYFSGDDVFVVVAGTGCGERVRKAGPNEAHYWQEARQPRRGIGLTATTAD